MLLLVCWYQKSHRKTCAGLIAALELHKVSQCFSLFIRGRRDVLVGRIWCSVRSTVSCNQLNCHVCFFAVQCQDSRVFSFNAGDQPCQGLDSVVWRYRCVEQCDASWRCKTVAHHRKEQLADWCSSGTVIRVVTVIRVEMGESGEPIRTGISSNACRLIYLRKVHGFTLFLMSCC